MFRMILSQFLLVCVDTALQPCEATFESTHNVHIVFTRLERVFKKHLEVAVKANTDDPILQLAGFNGFIKRCPQGRELDFPTSEEACKSAPKLFDDVDKETGACMRKATEKNAQHYIFNGRKHKLLPGESSWINHKMNFELRDLLGTKQWADNSPDSDKTDWMKWMEARSAPRNTLRITEKIPGGGLSNQRTEEYTVNLSHNNRADTALMDWLEQTHVWLSCNQAIAPDTNIFEPHRALLVAAKVCEREESSDDGEETVGNPSLGHASHGHASRPKTEETDKKASRVLYLTQAGTSGDRGY